MSASEQESRDWDTAELLTFYRDGRPTIMVCFSEITPDEFAKNAAYYMTQWGDDYAKTHPECAGLAWACARIRLHR